MALFSKTGVKVKVIRLEGGKDPDEIIKKHGIDRFGRLLDKADNDTEYKLSKLREKYIVETDDGKKITKRFVKGARLRYYPVGFNPFSCTRNCVQPTVSNCTYKTAKEKASAGTLTFTKTVVLKDTEKDFENTIQTEYYNTKRK